MITLTKIAKRGPNKTLSSAPWVSASFVSEGPNGRYSLVKLNFPAGDRMIAYRIELDQAGLKLLLETLSRYLDETEDKG